MFIYIVGVILPYEQCYCAEFQWGPPCLYYVTHGGVSTLFGLYIYELETYLDEIDGDSLCSSNMVVVILFYADDVVMLSKSRASLQRLLNNLR